MKLIMLIISIILSFLLLSGDQGEISLLKIDIPEPQLVKKKSLKINTEDVLKILENEDIKNIKANIEFATIDDYVIARLGKIEKGKISWAHKIVEKKFMIVKYGKSEYKGLIEKVRSGVGRPGYQIILSNRKSNAVINSFEITFRSFPNLKVELSYPVNTAPGEVIGEKVSITVTNEGTAPSGEFDLDIVLAKKFQIPMKKYTLSEGPEGVRLLEKGSIRMGAIEPGGVKEFKGDSSLQLPESLENGKYYLGAVVDSGLEVNESSEDDNVFRGFMMIAPKEPSKIVIVLEGTTLYYTPKSFNLTIKNFGLDISISKEWRKCQIRPYIYHLKHASWTDFFWEVNTDEKMVWKITDAKFCKSGGKAKKLNIRVIPKGGSTKVPPDMFRLVFKEMKILYEPKIKKFNMFLADCGIVYLPFWKTCKITPLKYHFKYETWDNKIWEINPLKKTLRKIPMEKFCKKSDQGEELPVKMDVSK